MNVLFPPETSLPTASLFITLHWAHHILSFIGLRQSIGLFEMTKSCHWLAITIASLLSISGDESSGGGVRISCSGDPSGKTPGTASTIAEEAVDQLQENEKLVAGRASDNVTQVSGDIRMFLSDLMKSGLGCGQT